MKALDWKLVFRCHLADTQLVVESSLTQATQDGEHAFSYLSKKLSPAEKNYFANDWEILGMIYFFQKFCRYLESIELKKLTDNQILKSVFK